MKKIVFLISVFFSTLLFADCIVYENKAYAETGYTAYEKECKAYGGGGSVFQGSINASSSTNTCNGGYADGAYVLRVSCNTCGSEIVQKDIQENKEFCKERCKSTQMYCSHTLNSWGSNLVGSVESCGLEDHTLPGCSESSSSAKSSSSSSVYNSSSSEQEYFSSSEDTNPASSNDVSCEYDCEESSSSEASSGSEDSSSSSSEESSSSGESSSSEESVSSSSESNLVACYTPDKNGGCKLSRSVSKVRPPMRGEPSLAENNMVFCEYENSQIYVGFFANIAAVKFVEDPTDYFSLCYYDESNCGNLTDPSAYPIPILKESFYECSMTTLHEDGCEPVMGIGIYVDRNLQISDWSESWIPSNVTRDQIIALGDEIVGIERSMIVYYNGKKIGSGHIANLKPRTLASAVDFCDYIIKEYEWDHRSSSSKQSESSSSSEASSSSVAEESSSSELQSSSSEQQYSSSSEKLADSSSSVFEEISSSSIGAETFVADGSQTYTSDQIFRDGLQNMEPGKCYSLNPEREPVTGWNLSHNAQDSWWWHEVDCETGEKPIENGIGVCAAYPGSKPSNTSTCYAYNGSCYRCDNDRDYVDCKADWLWNYNFPYHDWFKQVDCNEPYEEGKYICPEVSALRKNTSNVYFTDAYKDSEKLKSLSEPYHFDALGRSIKRNGTIKAKISIYSMTRKNEKETKINNTARSQFKAMFKTISGSVSAETYATFKYNATCSAKDYITLYITLELSTPENMINMNLEGDDEALKKHEVKHETIYKEYGNKKWEEQIEVSRQSTNKSVCKLVKEKYWTTIEAAMRHMLNLQNAWDDEDEKNINHARINVNLELSKLKKKWNESKCE